MNAATRCLRTPSDCHLLVNFEVCRVVICRLRLSLGLIRWVMIHHQTCLLAMQREHHLLKLFKVYHTVAILVELLDQSLPVLIWDLFILVTKDVLQFSWCNLAVCIQVKQVKSLLKMLLCQHLVEIRCGRHELTIFNEAIPIHVNLLHDLLELSLKKHLLS